MCAQKMLAPAVTKATSTISKFRGWARILRLLLVFHLLQGSGTWIFICETDTQNIKIRGTRRHQFCCIHHLTGCKTSQCRLQEGAQHTQHLWSSVANRCSHLQEFFLGSFRELNGSTGVLGSCGLVSTRPSNIQVTLVSSCVCILLSSSVSVCARVCPHL